MKRMSAKLKEFLVNFAPILLELEIVPFPHLTEQVSNLQREVLNLALSIEWENDAAAMGQQCSWLMLLANQGILGND